MLDRLRAAGADEQARALADRAAAHVPLDDPAAAARLLDSLRELGADEQVTALLHRDPATRVLLNANDPGGVGWLLDRLRELGADGQARALADRLPGAGMFKLFREHGDRQDQFRFGREADGSPANPWGWGDLD